MDNVLYFLGAGFSAPFGLPVMSNFLQMAKDQYFSNPDKYESFKHVFEEIRSYSVSTGYFAGDLFNIEEILSILEMRNQIAEKGQQKPFIDFIVDVISYHTPEFRMSPRQVIPSGNWSQHLWGNNQQLNHLGAFVACLLKMEARENQQYRESDDLEARFKVLPYSLQAPNYAVVSLNYDMLLEDCCKFVHSHYDCGQHGVSFGHSNRGADPWQSKRPILAKLHGSVDTGDIVPPTWSKVVDSRIREAWRAAFDLVQGANHIRFIGYSLPLADSYVKYLLKSAIVDAPHLKTIDVICHDSTGDVKRRYDEFIRFPNYQFLNGTTQAYLSGLGGHTPTTQDGAGFSFCRFSNLEAVHRQYAAKHSV